MSRLGDIAAARGARNYREYREGLPPRPSRYPRRAGLALKDETHGQNRNGRRAGKATNARILLELKAIRKELSTWGRI